MVESPVRVRRGVEAQVERLDVECFELPVDGPDGKESDGTLEWSSTAMVVVHAHGGGKTGLGYTYSDRAAAELVRGTLAPLVEDADALAPAAVWRRCAAALRNVGRPGVGFMALSAVDVALWDLKARLLELPLVDVLPAAHDAVPVYGSGGFCNYPLERLREQLGGWVADGIPRVKMKLGRDPGRDPARLDAVRDELGPDVELYVDANGAFARKEAVAWSQRYAERWAVSWFEEPVSSADFAGLRQVRERAPGGLDIAAGEYAFVLADFHNLVAAEAIDCLQADVTRCGGITGLLSVAGFAAGSQLDVSGHCAPQLSAHALTACPTLRHLEYFHDHDRFERLVFDGCLDPEDGLLRPDRSRPGHGLELKRADAERLAV